MTISEVARRAEVSPAVVSRVLNEDATLRISPETRARVLSAVEQLDYVPRHAARSLRMHLPSVISLVVPDSTSALWSEMVRGVEEAASERNLAVNLLRAEHMEREPGWLPRLVREGRTDGLLLQMPDRVAEEAFADLSALGIPLVLLNSIDRGALATVIFDDLAAVQTGLKALVELGHRRIGYVGGPIANSPARRRSSAFFAVAAKFGIEVQPEWITDFGFTTDDGRVAARAILGAENRPSAVLIANVNAAMGFIAEAHRIGSVLPDDLSMIALHEVPYAEATWPPLSTIEMPNAALGSAAVELLFDRGPEVKHVTITEPAPILHLRASTVAVR